MRNPKKHIPAEIINFWFAEVNKKKWFMKDPNFDKLITEKFLPVYEQISRGVLDSWKNTPEGILALIIVLDQFSRNMFRGQKKSFDTDAQALLLAKQAIATKMDKRLPAFYQKFIYMPFIHSEALQDQNLSLQLFVSDPETYGYAIKHREIIEKFGRFPHRNNLLGRQSTPEELHFLQLPNSAF